MREGGAALELLRISCNPIESLPDELWSACCPKLAWFGCAAVGPVPPAARRGGELSLTLTLTLTLTRCAGSPYHQRHAEAALALVSAEEGARRQQLTLSLALALTLTLTLTQP